MKKKGDEAASLWILISKRGAGNNDDDQNWKNLTNYKGVLFNPISSYTRSEKKLSHKARAKKLAEKDAPVE